MMLHVPALKERTPAPNRRDGLIVTRLRFEMPGAKSKSQ